VWLLSFHRVKKTHLELITGLFQGRRRRRSLIIKEPWSACKETTNLGPHPLFNDRQFLVMFRISRSCFQRLMEDVAATGNPFHLNTKDIFKKTGSSSKPKLRLPLKTLAHGVPPHNFRGYFQQSQTLARKSVELFCDTIRDIHKEECLHCHPRADLRNIV
jgi:hypothetical protein